MILTSSWLMLNIFSHTKRKLQISSTIFKTSSSNNLPFVMWNLYTGSWWTPEIIKVDYHWQRRVLTAGGKTVLVVPVDLTVFEDFEGWRTEFRKFNSSHLTSSRLLSWKFKLVYAVCYLLEGHFESINYNYTLPFVFSFNFPPLEKKWTCHFN